MTPAGLRRALRQARDSSFVRSVAETLATRLLLIAVGVATSIVVTRALGPSGRGLLAVALALGGLGVQFGNLGLHAANTYSVAGHPERLPRLAANSLVVSLGIGGAAAAGLWLVLAAFPGLVGIGGPLLALAVAWIPLGLAYLLFQNLLVGVQDIRGYNLAELGNRLVSLALVGVVILVGAVAPATVFLASLAGLAASFLWVVVRLGVPLRPLPTPSPALFVENLRYSLKAYFAALFMHLVLRADLLLLQNLRGPADTGLYAVAVAVADLVYLLPTVAGTVLFPRLTALADGGARWVLARRVAIAVGVLMGGAGLALGLVARPLLRLLYGAAFAAAAPPLVWLLPGIVLLSVNTILMNYFASTGMPAVTVYSPAAAALLNVGLNLWLIPELGPAGAALASSVAYGLMLLFSLAHLARSGRAEAPA